LAKSLVLDDKAFKNKIEKYSIVPPNVDDIKEHMKNRTASVGADLEYSSNFLSL